MKTQRTMRGRGPTALAAMLALGGTTACYTGTDVHSTGSASAGVAEGGSDGAEDGVPADGTGIDPECVDLIPEGSLRRLTPAQSRNTLRDLFGDPQLDVSYEDDAPVITELGVRQLRASAEQILARRDQWTTEVYGCATDSSADDDCARDFIERFGARVFRRPLNPTDTDWLWAVYETALLDEGLSFSDAMDVVLATMLQAPDHVYIIERGVPVEGGPEDLRRLTDHELANRLSYLLWDSMPDAELQEAADAGELSDEALLKAQVERMIRSPKAEGRLQTFVSEWLHLDGHGLLFSIEEAPKDPELYPEFDPAMRDAMREELEATVREVLLGDGDATLERLLLEPRAYVNASLAEFYGVQGPASDETWEWVELPPDERAGLLTRGAFLSVHASPRVPSPIYRGTTVLGQLLCQPLPPPPPDVDDTPIEDGDADDGTVKTIRELVEARTSGQECTGCHSIINPTGFTFGHYDAIGRWRDTELTSGLPVDAVASLPVGDVAGPMDDAVALSHALADSEDAYACFAEHWLTTAFGVHADECTQAQITEDFIASDGDVRVLITSIAHSGAFRHIRVPQGE